MKLNCSPSKCLCLQHLIKNKVGVGIIGKAFLNKDRNLDLFGMQHSGVCACIWAHTSRPDSAGPHSQVPAGCVQHQA